MSTRPVNVLRYGVPEDLPEIIPLRAGPLSLIYTAGDLRYIRLGENEILRRVYVAVRDRNWDTIPAVLSNVVIDRRDDSFEIRYHALHQERDICFEWDATIVGTTEGKISYLMDGAACSTFWRNRIGICVLHPTEECAGVPCRVTHTDGRITEGILPRYISPHQPYKDIRAIAHQVKPGLWAEVRLEGDVFEMEDQRNWTDASFKTYSTPLEWPFPVCIEKGTPVHQSLTLTLEGDVRAVPQPPRSLALRVGDIVRQQRPPIGLGVASHGLRLEAHEVERLHALNLGHLRVDLALQSDWDQALALADEQAFALGVGLEIGLPLAKLDTLNQGRLLAALGRLKSRVLRWLLFTDHLDVETAAARIAWARAAFEPLAPGAAVAVGTNAYFTELNRNRPPLEHADLLCYSLNPQVHAFDNLSLVETLGVQGVTVESACQFAQGRGIVVSPVTLCPRFNPNATAPERPPLPGRLPSTVDARQMSLFGAAWTLVSLKYLMSHPAVHSLTYYETTGWRGVMETRQGSPVAAFASRPGEVFPLYHVFRWVGRYPEAAVRTVCSSAPFEVDGLALQQGERLMVGVANLTNASQEVEISGVPGAMHCVMLDETNVEDAMQNPEPLQKATGERFIPSEGHLTLTLAPYAVAWLEGSA